MGKPGRNRNLKSGRNRDQRDERNRFTGLSSHQEYLARKNGRKLVYHEQSPEALLEEKLWKEKLEAERFARLRGAK